MILAIRRAARYSPNSVDKDNAILERVVERLRSVGHCVVVVDEDSLSGDLCVNAYISMARSEKALDILRKHASEGSLVINTPVGVALCGNRRRLFDMLRNYGMKVPPAEGEHGVWLKRAEGTSQAATDIQYAANDAERAIKEEIMYKAGIKEIVSYAHIEGDLVKFYGVRGTDFFTTHYPADDGDWKFDDERINGAAHHYNYNLDRLREMADMTARLTGLTVYGGDCIVDKDGGIWIIDFNDWPSFSRCREEAATAIANVVDLKMRNRY